jgi:hypothetical protein
MVIKLIRDEEHLNSLRRGGLEADFTASNLATAALVKAVSVAYVPSANTFGRVAAAFSFSLDSPPSSSRTPSPLTFPLASSNNFCSEAKIGISPNTFLISRMASLMIGSVSTYSPRIHNTPRKTFPDLISETVEMSFSQMEGRRGGNFSTTSL